MSLYNKLEQRYTIESIPELLRSEQSVVKCSDFQTCFETISCNKFYQKRLLKLFIDNPSLLIHERATQEELDDIEELQEWIQETYMSYLNVQFDPDVVDIITYNIPTDECLMKIKIREIPYKISGNNTTGFRTWEAALYLIYYMYTEKGVFDNYSTGHAESVNVLELGSGTGICGLALYKYGFGSVGNNKVFKKIALTDGSEEIVQDIIPFNYHSNQTDICDAQAKLDIKQLLWGKEHFQHDLKHKHDLIIGADVTYDDRVIPLLVESIDFYMSEDSNAQCIISATIRNIDTINFFVECFKRDEFAHKLKIVKLSDTQSINKDKLNFFKENVWFKEMIAPICIYQITRVL